MILALLACGAPAEEAPPTFDALCRGAYADWDDEDALAEHLAGLRDFLDGHDEPEGWGIEPLVDDDVAALDRPDRPIGDADGAVGQAPSVHDLDSHVALVLLADQSVVGSNYDRFDRTFVEGGDCFAEHGCDRLVTQNDIVKVTLGVKLPYAYEKDYRWIGDDAVVARGWLPTEATSEDGSIAIYQSFTLDVFLAEDEGIRRLQAQWAELDLGAANALGEETLLNLSVDGLLDVLEDTDEAIVELAL